MTDLQLTVRLMVSFINKNVLCRINIVHCCAIFLCYLGREIIITEIQMYFSISVVFWCFGQIDIQQNLQTYISLAFEGNASSSSEIQTLIPNSNDRDHLVGQLTRIFGTL